MRKFLISFLAAWLLASQALAVPIIAFRETTGLTLTLEVRIDGSTTDTGDFVEAPTGWYTLDDSELAGLPAGVYPWVVLSSGSVIREGSMYWDGTTSVNNFEQLSAIRDTTDTFDDLPAEAITPPVSGSSHIGRAILDGRLGKVAFLGDSVLQNMGPAVNLWMARPSIAGFGNASDWYAGGTLTGVFVGTAHTSDFGDFAEGGGRWAEINFAGGTSDASTTSTANRMLDLARVGPKTAVTSQYEAEWTSTQQQWAFGYDWLADNLDDKDLTIRFPVYTHSGGTTVANEYFVLKNGSTVIATSGYVSTYSASPGYKWVEATIPQGTSTPLDSGLSVEVRFKASTASENGKVSYWSSRGEILDKTNAAGSLVHIFGQGGLTVDNYHNGLNWTDTSMGVFGLIKPDVFVIELGLNDSSGASAAAFATDLDALVDRLRGFCPNCKIIFWGLWGRYSEDPLYGGGGTEPYFIPGMYQAQQATPNSAFINTCRLMPNIRVLSGPYRDVVNMMQWNGVPASTYIHKGAVVEYNTNLYAAKLSHTKTATNPSADTTNWALLSTYDSFNQRQLKIYDLNPVTYDKLHPHLHGGYLAMQSFTDGLHMLQYFGGGAAIANNVDDILTPELSRITTALPNSVPNIDGGLPLLNDGYVPANTVGINGENASATLLTEVPSAVLTAAAATPIQADMRKVEGHSAIDGFNLAQYLSIIGANAAGPITGSATSEPVVKSVDNDVNRIEAVVAPSGDRTITVDVSDLIETP